MGPDLRNVISVTEAGNGQIPRNVVRHRAFPEVQAEGNSPREAFLALRSALVRSRAWSTVAWHAVDLARAVFDVESNLWLLDCPDRAMISGGQQSKIIKEYDTVYYLTCCPDENGTVGAYGDDDAPGIIETPDGPDLTPSILIYSLGRRRGAARQARSGEETTAARQERNPVDRRTGDRRHSSRISLIAETLLACETRDEMGMGGSELRNGAVMGRDRSEEALGLKG